MSTNQNYRIDTSLEIEECHNKKDYPCFSLQNLKDYFSDEKEHFFLKKINLKNSVPYKPSFNFNFYQFPEQKKGIFKLLRQLLFCEDQNLTKQFGDKFCALTKDYEGEAIASSIPSCFIPKPSILYYCCSKNHGFDDNRYKKYCEKCEKEIDSSNYIVIFDLREQIHIKLFSLGEEMVRKLIEKTNYKIRLLVILQKKVLFMTSILVFFIIF